MNGSGIIGRLENLPAFFQKAKQLLRPGGSILMDSSDLRYLYEDEDGSFVINIADEYYGEVDFQMQYKERAIRSTGSISTSRPFLSTPHKTDSKPNW